MVFRVYVKDQQNITCQGWIANLEKWQSPRGPHKLQAYCVSTGLD